MPKYKTLTCMIAVCLLLTSCVWLLLPAAAQTQASSGQIAGTVKDAAGAVIPDAAVEVQNLGTGLKQAVKTNADGSYRLVLLPAGHYRVTVSAPGFAAGRGAADVQVGRIAELNFSLAVGTRKEEVTVTAEMIEAQRHEAAAFMGAAVVSNIPLNGRRFQDVATLTPTVQIDPQRGGMAMTGQRMVNTGSINVDGADYGQLFFGGIRGGERANFAPTIPLDSIQEFQIVRAGYTAEFGRSTGGTITAITKSGTNEFHGSGGYVIRHEALARTNEYYDTVRSSLQASCPTCVVNPNPTLHQWGGSVGGPIKKDKLFVFGSYDQQRQRLPHQVFLDRLVTGAGSPAFPGRTASNGEAYDVLKALEAPFQQTNDAWLFLIKGDYQFSNKHRLSVRYNHSNYEGANAVSVGTSLAPTLTNAVSNNGTEIDKTRTLVGQLTSYFGSFANEFRGQYARETRPRNANSLAPTVQAGTSSTSNIAIYGTSSFLGQNLEYDYRIQFADNITWMKGPHTVKAGFEYNYIYAAQTFGFNQFGAFSFTTSDTNTILQIMSLTPGVATDHRFDSTSVNYSRQIGNLQTTLPGHQLGAFVQDSWRVTPGFTLNYGLRWEAAINPKPTANNAMVSLVKGFVFPLGFTEDPGKIPNQTAQFAPRVGFAWTPWKDGKTVIRGFGGIYFAATPMLLYADPVNNFREPPGNLSTQLPITGIAAGTVVPGCPSPCNTVYQQLQIVGINLDSYTLDKLPVVSIDQIKTIAGTINTAQGKAFNPYTGAGPIFVENNFHNPRSYQAGFGVEHELAQGWTLGLEGTWIKTVYLERNRELNMPLPVCVDAAGRSVYRLTGTAPTGCPSAATPRPISSLGQVQVRDSSAKSLYRGLTFRTAFQRRRAQVVAYYTLSENISDDDNERTSGGFVYADHVNLRPEYSFSNLDRKHQFVVSPVFFLPWNLDVSSAIRLLSGAPQSATLGSDANQDRTTSERPYSAVGVPFKRNSFRDRALTFIDLRVQKSIPIRERKQVKLSAEFFNLFNFMNLTYSGSAVTNYCTSTTAVTCGIPGGAWSSNPNFLKLRDSNPTSANFGKLLTNNNAGVPFQAQFSARFIF